MLIEWRRAIFYNKEKKNIIDTSHSSPGRSPLKSNTVLSTYVGMLDHVRRQGQSEQSIAAGY
jgi:hypothetical protein